MIEYYIVYSFVILVILEIFGQLFLSIFKPKTLFKLQGRGNCPITLSLIGGAIATAVAWAGGAVAGGLGAIGGVAGLSGTAAVVGGGAMVASAAGSAVGAVTSIQSGIAAQEAAEYNADMMKYNADIADQQAIQRQKAGDLELRQQRARVAGLIGTQRAGFGASGAVVDTGSPLALIEDTEYLGEQDAITLQHNTALDVWGMNNKSAQFSSRASLYKSQGSNAVSQGYLGAGSSLLSGASTLTTFGLGISK